MTARKSKAKAPAPDPAAPTPLQIDGSSGESAREMVARKMLNPCTRHGMAAGETISRLTESFDPANSPGLTEYAWALRARAERASAGDLADASEILAVQAITLDTIFAEYTRLAAVNVGKNLDAAERLLRLALKAQAGSRATVEALAKLHQPREQTVRHVHVNEGGQAVIADQFHHHAGGAENGQSADQPHAQSTRGPALPCPDPIGPAVQVPSHQGQGPVPDARRQRQRCA